MQETQLPPQRLITSEDAARWVTFSGFWGAIFYLLAFVSLTLAQRRQPFQLNTRPFLLGMAIHVTSFVTAGSLASAAVSLRSGKRTTDMARERIATGRLDHKNYAPGIGAAFGSVLPFGWALASLRAAERLTGERVLPEGETRWGYALATMAVGSSAAAITITQIATWIAGDARATRE